MKKILEKFAVGLIYVFSFVLLIEIGVNYGAFYYLFPIKNDTSFGYVIKKSGKTVIPLNKYSSRLKAQIALPFELACTLLSSKTLKKHHDKITDTYGFVNEKNKTVIEHKFAQVQDFTGDYAIVAIKVNDKLKYGTINNRGEWIIEPKYEYLCPFFKYYTRACVDKKHCGVIDRYGNQVTLMTYKTDNLKCKGENCGIKLCTVGKDKKEISCNYFL